MTHQELLKTAPSFLEKAPTQKDYTLVEVGIDHSVSQLTALLRKKQNWLINPISGHGFTYPLILSNLSRKRHDLNTSSVESIRQIIHNGLPKVAFEQLKLITSVPGELLATVVGIPARTLARRTVFKPDETGSILRVAATFQKTLEVHEDLSLARKWFVTGKRSLGGACPLEFCDTEPGTAEVMNLLTRIEHGVFS